MANQANSTVKAWTTIKKLTNILCQRLHIVYIELFCTTSAKRDQDLVLLTHSIPEHCKPSVHTNFLMQSTSFTDLLTSSTLNVLRTLWVLFEPPLTRKKTNSLTFANRQGMDERHAGIKGSVRTHQSKNLVKRRWFAWSTSLFGKRWSDLMFPLQTFATEWPKFPGMPFPDSAILCVYLSFT